MTDIFVLEKLNLKLGDEISLLELDERVEKFIDNENIETPLSAFWADQIISWGVYTFYDDENYDLSYKINFEVVKNTNDENTIIKIVKF